MKLPTAAAIWATIVALAAILGIWHGFRGRQFALALGVAAALFAFEFFLAAPESSASVQGMLGGRGGIVAPLVPLFAVLDVFVRSDWRLEDDARRRGLHGLPAFSSQAAAGKSPGTWEDYAAVASALAAG